MHDARQAPLGLGLETSGPAAASARSGCWTAVASTDPVLRGRAKGFMQVCHGRPAPLCRLRPGDRVVHDSPTWTMGGREPVRPSPRSARSRPASPARSTWAAASCRGGATWTGVPTTLPHLGADRPGRTGLFHRPQPGRIPAPHMTLPPRNGRHPVSLTRLTSA